MLLVAFAGQQRLEGILVSLPHHCKCICGVEGECCCIIASNVLQDSQMDSCEHICKPDQLNVACCRRRYLQHNTG